eukprot:8004995-Pyramimonas_sp.AAC.1
MPEPWRVGGFPPRQHHPMCTEIGLRPRSQKPRSSRKFYLLRRSSHQSNQTTWAMSHVSRSVERLPKTGCN